MFFEDIHAFVAVVRGGSFSRAAVDLCVAQSALSRRVQRLEARLGTKLLSRHARGIALTEAGTAFLQKAGRLVDEVSAMEHDLSSLVEEPSGLVRVAFPQRSSGLLGPRLFARVLKELPRVQLDILEGNPSNIHGWLGQGEVDIALSYTDEIGPAYEVQSVLTESLHLFAAPKLLQQVFGQEVPERLSMRDLCRVPMVMPKRPYIVRVLVDRLCQLNGLRPNVLFETEGIFTTRGIVEMGLAGMVFSLSATVSNLLVKDRKAVALPFQSPLMAWQLYIARAKQAQNLVAVNRVHQILLEEVDTLIDKGAWAYARRTPQPA